MKTYPDQGFRLFAVILLCVCIPLQSFSQVPSLRKSYWRSASEFIFSFSDIQGNDTLAVDQELSPLLRFSGFFNLQSQYHYDFTSSFGISTGFGVRNVGFINTIGDSITLKQRVYSFGVPLAVKFGRLPDDFTFSVGVEPELFFHYKQKAIYDDEKYKKMGWFSNRVNMFNPSVFLEVRFKSNTFIRCKYYLDDVLVQDNQTLNVGEKSIYYKPESSKMFYVSIGMAVLDKPRKKEQTGNDVYSLH